MGSCIVRRDETKGDKTDINKVKRIYILVLITVMDRAGAETMMMNYLRYIDRNKIQMDFLINRQEKADYEKEIEGLGSKVYHMSPLYPGKFHQYKKEFRMFLRQHPQYKIIHSHLEERSYFALKIAKEEGITTRIVHAHSVPRGHNLKMIMRLYFRKRLRKYYTHAFACGENPAKWLFGTTEDVIFMRNAVDTKRFRFNASIRNKIRKSLKIKENQLVIGHIGRFVEEKNQMFLVDIFKEISRQMPDSRLLFIGGGKPKAEEKYKEKVKKKVKETGLESKVCFLGVRDDIEKLIQGIDVLVMPSLSEGFPVTLVEAQSAGTPCVVSGVVSNEVNVTGELQYQSVFDDAVEWANKIVSMTQADFYRNASTGGKRGQEQREEMCEKVAGAGLDIKENAKWLEEFYESVSVAYEDY